MMNMSLPRWMGSASVVTRVERDATRDSTRQVREEADVARLPGAQDGELQGARIQDAGQGVRRVEALLEGGQDQGHDACQGARWSALQSEPLLQIGLEQALAFGSSAL